MLGDLRSLSEGCPQQVSIATSGKSGRWPFWEVPPQKAEVLASAGPPSSRPGSDPGGDHLGGDVALGPYGGSPREVFRVTAMLVHPRRRHGRCSSSRVAETLHQVPLIAGGRGLNAAGADFCGSGDVG